MSKSLKMLLVAATGLVMAGGIAVAATMLTAKNGMTIYTFDKDTGAESTCYDECAVNWPPYMAEADAKLSEGWTMVKRKDGKMQWAYDGHPMYFFKGDAKAGDAAGDGMKGVWHVVKE
jgi:predicted lipoprotein with Yx(FWY)xxD motif